MSIPKSVTKVKSKKGVISLEFTDNCDRVNYTMKELARAALRDVGKFVCKNFRNDFYNNFRKYSGRVGKYTQYWVKYKQEDMPHLEVGIKPMGFYGGMQEFGTSTGIPRYNLLTNSAQNHIAEIVQIESQYLSALEDEAKALSQISEEDYSGGAED